jgi:hypothetical protein
LNEEQYKQVCEACDRVLEMPGSTLGRMSIPWLHVLREHPSFLKDYEGLFAPSTLLGNVARAAAAKARNSAGWLRQLWRALKSDGEPWAASQPLSAPVDVLFISHLLNDADAGKAADFYFGDLPERLRAEGHRVVVALIDHAGTSGASRVQRWDASAGPRVLLSRTLGFQGELSLWQGLRRESSRLASLSRREPPGLLKKVFARASLEAMSGPARATLRMSVQISRLASTIQPNVMIVTYEGHAWERVVFSAAREACAGVQCVGYQHAAIFRLQHGALRKLGPPFDPDLVLTAGSVSKGQIENSTGMRGIPVRVLGSNRASPPLRRPESALSQDDCQVFGPGCGVCLVLPEGIISECLLLFEFSLRCAELMPDMRFIWRLHPLVKPEDLVKANPRLRALPANVEFSNNAFEADLQRASCALYRGSTAIVKAASFGLQPVYLAQAGEMTIDPLYELDGLLLKVRHPQEFQAVFGAGKSTPDAIRNQEAIAHYCDAFYSVAEPAVILSMLSKP